MTTPDTAAQVAEKLRRNAAEAGECEICPVLVAEAADTIDALTDRVAELEAEVLEQARLHFGKGQPPMTSTDTDALIERLRAYDCQVNGYCRFTGNWLRNPDGPEAADLIDALRAENADLIAKLDKLGEHHAEG